MSEPLPLYLVGRPEGRLAGLAALGAATEIIPPEQAESVGGRPPGVVLLDPEGMSAPDLLAVASLPAEGWIVGVVGPEEPPQVRTLSLGVAETADDVRRHLMDPAEAPAHLLTLHRALSEIARVRHDLNNPLTAAMAEAQLCLMEAADEAERNSFETVLEQLRRIRDMVAATRHLRPPRE